jgi:phosphoribosyl-dephospho-CoA transferase
MNASLKTCDCLAHDLLQISGARDLVCVEKGYPVWAIDALGNAPFVVVRRSNSIDGLVPVGVRGSLREQRFAAYLEVESVLQRIIPDQLTEKQGWFANARTQQIPALRALAAATESLANFSLAYGPTGSVGFELASGLPTATAASDLDLLIRAPERLSMQLAQELMKIFSRIPCRIDTQLETPRGAVSLAEFASGRRPLLLRQSGGPVLVDDLWEPQIA